MAISESASPRATLGPVVEKSLNLVVPISIKPMMIVPALVTRGMNDRLSVCFITPAGFSGLKCSANRQEMKRQKSVPVPNRIATRNNSTRGEISQPAVLSQASNPRAMIRLMPIVASGTIARKNDR